MRVRTRRSFAAPLVLVVACSSGGGTPPERTTPPAPPIAAPADAAVDASEPVAAVDAPRGVAVVDAPEVVAMAVDAGVVAMAVDAGAAPDAGVPDPRKPPPFPRCAGPIAPDNPCNPPRPRRIEATIIDVRQEAGLVFRVNRGAEHGIDKRWQVELRGTNGGVIPKFRGQIVRITARDSEIRFREKADRPLREYRVYLVPP